MFLSNLRRSRGLYSSYVVGCTALLSIVCSFFFLYSIVFRTLGLSTPPWTSVPGIPSQLRDRWGPWGVSRVFPVHVLSDDVLDIPALILYSRKRSASYVQLKKWLQVLTVRFKTRPSRSFEKAGYSLNAVFDSSTDWQDLTDDVAAIVI